MQRFDLHNLVFDLFQTLSHCLLVQTHCLKIASNHAAFNKKFMENPALEFQLVENFLGIPHAPTISFETHNARKTPRSVTVHRIITNARLRRIGKAILPGNLASQIGQYIFNELNARPAERQEIPKHLRSEIQSLAQQEKDSLEALLGIKITHW